MCLNFNTQFIFPFSPQFFLSIYLAVTVLTLSNMTSGMTEPCVMDIKIGKRTWDPLALPEKRASEDKKYAKTKQAYGFSITGFQFYDVITSSLKTFDKDYGKNLNSATVIEGNKN